MASLRSLFRRIAGAFAPSSVGPGAAATAPAGTVEVSPHEVRGLTLTYAPREDGRADAGEIGWTWVPFVERDGRGKDRPVLVVAPQGAGRVYAVKLTSRSRDGDREYLSIGTGPWDAQGRPSWVDLDQLYSVPVHGLRREGVALDRARFDLVATALRARYGWKRG